jgi:transcriptional regulator with XRE-family HTH domain
MSEQEVFGVRLKRRRQMLGLNQQQLAAQLGMRVASISRYERGEYQEMTFARLRQIATVLKTSADFLLGLSNDPGPIPDRASPGEEQRLRSNTLPLATAISQGDHDCGEYTNFP